MEPEKSVPWMGELQVRRYRLANGLRVVFCRDPTAPVFACHTWYDVGSRDERPGRTGMAHLFEHLMFKETKNLGDGEFDRQMEVRGASTNAATYLDWTFYHEELRREHLDFCLGIEADRMANMILSPEQLEPEREVVKNERLMRTENDPEGAMYEALYETAYRAHSYRWPVIGRKPDLDAITLEDCLGFYKDFYAPNNAVLVLVGDLDEAETMATVERHYGALPSSAVRRPEVVPEPAQEREQRVRLEKPVSAEMGLIAYHVPEFTHSDMPALEVANAVLFDGPSSRLERRLVADLQLVTRVEGMLPSTKDPGLWEIFLGMREGLPLFRAETEMYEAFDAMGRELVGHEELERAKSRLEAGFYRGLREATDKAYQLGFHEVVAGDFEVLVHSMERWARVTREDVREVCDRYLTRQGRTVVHTFPLAEAEARDVAARPGHVALGGGARLYVEPSADLPLVSYRVVLRAGAMLDPPGKEGLGYLTVQMLERGTQSLRREAYEEAADGIGASLQNYVGHLTAAFGGEVPARNFPRLRELVEDALLHPAFDEVELQKLKLQVLSEILEMQNDDHQLVGRYLRHHVFPDHPYGKDLRGTQASLMGITIQEVRAHHATLLRRGSVVVASAGDVDPADLEAHARAFVAEVPEGPAPEILAPPPPTRGGRRLLLVDKPERSQVHYAMGARGLRAGDPDWLPMKVAESAYGGTFTSRLMQELRVKTGWTYGTYSSDSRGRIEDLYIQVAYPSDEDAPACIARHLELFEAHCRGELDEAELQAARDYLVNRTPFAFDSAPKRLNKLMEPDFLEIPEDYWATYEARVRAVTRAQVREAVARHRSAEHLSLVVVCTAAGFAERLAAAGLEFASVETVDYRELL